MGLSYLNIVWRANYQLWKWKHTCYCFGENQVKMNPLQTNSYDTSQVSSWNKIFALAGRKPSNSVSTLENAETLSEPLFKKSLFLLDSQIYEQESHSHCCTPKITICTLINLVVPQTMYCSVAQEAQHSHTHQWQQNNRDFTRKP